MIFLYLVSWIFLGGYVSSFARGLAPIVPDKIPAFVINFDEPAATRYNEVFHYFRDDIIAMENSIMYSIAPFYRSTFMNNTDTIAQNNPEAFEAMQALATITGLPVWQTLMVNSLVDFYSYCVSIVGVMADGSVIHGRNHDVDNPALFQPILHRIFIKSGGAVIGEAASHAGFIGFYTAMRYNSYSVTYNTRMSPHTNTNQILENIQREWTPGVQTVAQAIESVVLQHTSMDMAAQYLETKALVTPAYLILANAVAPIAAKDQVVGMVITRDPSALNRTDVLHYPESDATKWYLVQGNKDYWQTDDSNYAAAVERMEALGRQKLNLETLVTEVLNCTGVVGPYTSYSASMSAQTKTLSVYFTPLQ
eukprot:gene13726-9828_t